MAFLNYVLLNYEKRRGKLGNFCDGTTWIKPEYFGKKTAKYTNKRSEHPSYQQQKTSNIPKK